MDNDDAVELAIKQGELRSARSNASFYFTDSSSDSEHEVGYRGMDILDFLRGESSAALRLAKRALKAVVRRQDGWLKWAETRARQPAKK